MPSHFHVAFGLKDLFRFNFKFGSRDHAKIKSRNADYRCNLYDADMAKVISPEMFAYVLT